MPFKIPRNCDTDLAWQICLGKEPPTTQKGLWGRSRRQAKAFATSSWKLKAEDISGILADSTKRKTAIATITANPRWLRADLSLATAVYKQLGSGGEEEKLKGLIANRSKFKSIARKRLGRRDSLENQFLQAASEGDVDLLRLLLITDPKLAQYSDRLGQTALHMAAYNGHEGCVSALLESDDTDVNLADNKGHTALHRAAQNDHKGCLSVLLEREDIDVNLADEDGWAALHYAASGGNEGCVRALLERVDVDVNRANTNGDTALHRAAYNGHEGCVRALSGVGGIDANQVGNKGHTALHWAAQNGHEACVRALLENDDINVNQADNENQTALLMAAFKGHVECVRKILKRDDVDIYYVSNNGTKVQSFNNSEIRSLLLAFYWRTNKFDEISANSSELLKVLTKEQISEKMLTTDLFSRMDTENAKLFLGETGVNFVALVRGNDFEGLKKRKKKTDRFSNTLLIYAAAQNRIDVVEMLLQVKVELHSRNRAGESAIDLAAKMGHSKVCLRLLKKCHLKQQYQMAAILAAANGHANLLTQLIAAYPWLLTNGVRRAYS
ncbi:MAG: hypothetical protein KR126chlam2_00486 [Chlamydiae bacterium]|nr:hypothetical protein [Chlamydiota bacterium]